MLSLSEITFKFQQKYFQYLTQIKLLFVLSEDWKCCKIQYFNATSENFGDIVHCSKQETIDFHNLKVYNYIEAEIMIFWYFIGVFVFIFWFIEWSFSINYFLSNHTDYQVVNNKWTEYNPYKTEMSLDYQIWVGKQ